MLGDGVEAEVEAEVINDEIQTVNSFSS